MKPDESEEVKSLPQVIRTQASSEPDTTNDALLCLVQKLSDAFSSLIWVENWVAQARERTISHGLEIVSKVQNSASLVSKSHLPPPPPSSSFFFFSFFFLFFFFLFVSERDLYLFVMTLFLHLVETKLPYSLIIC